MSAPCEAPPLPPQAAPVNVDIALACLRGFSRPISCDGPSGAEAEALHTTTYLDWSSHKLERVRTGTPLKPDEWSKALDSALASASHPLLFRARRLNREAMRGEYERRKYVNLPPAPLRLWYSDGGVVNNEPLLRSLKQVTERDGAREASRLVLLVRAGSHDLPASDDPAWAGVPQPNWVETIVRAFDIMAIHASANDLLRVEKINVRIRWTRNVATTIGPFLREHPSLHDRLRELLATIYEEGAALGESKPTRGPSHDGSEVTALLERVLLAAAGLSGKREVDVAVVLPDPAYAVSPRGAVLDFLELRGREDRFAAGYHTMLNWIERAPAVAKRVPLDRSQAAREAAARKVRRPRPARPSGRKRLGLSVPTRAALGQLGVRVARIGIEDMYAVRRKRSAVRGQQRSSPRA
jgi:hypothetical protein